MCACVCRLIVEIFKHEKVEWFNGLVCPTSGFSDCNSYFFNHKYFSIYLWEVGSFLKPQCRYHTPNSSKSSISDIFSFTFPCLFLITEVTYISCRVLWTGLTAHHSVWWFLWEYMFVEPGFGPQGLWVWSIWVALSVLLLMRMGASVNVWS